MKASYILPLFFLLTGGCGLLALPTSGQPNTFNFEQLEELQQRDARPVVVFIYTDWCKYCYIMKRTSFRNMEVVKQLNRSFYFIQLNAEERQELRFSGASFAYRPTGNGTGVHELAEHLGSLNGRLSYPSICILDSDNKTIYLKAGYISAREIVRVLAALAD